MWSTPVFGTDLYHIAHWFIVYSILGWVMESIYMSICNHKLTNRGFIKSPFCPIYGVGALIVYFVLRPLQTNYLMIYLVGAILATVFEFLVAQLMLKLFGSVWWDYSHKPFNYKGILCLESTLAWGLYSVFLFGFLQDFVMWIVGRYSFEAGRMVGNIVLMIVFVDMFAHVYLKKREFFADSLTLLREKWRNFRQ